MKNSFITRVFSFCISKKMANSIRLFYEELSASALHYNKPNSNCGNNPKAMVSKAA
ncbi:MAG: hypothetical protein RIT03_992 [Bacteroidota bacterium]|jgi:hypothetical protein